ncbi:MAG: ATP-dependent Clp protease proteolytic subunit [Fibrobacter sp.]|nr:ATP-dependent Clp protease proteolytic subunit [Fibrobacter sp.]
MKFVTKILVFLAVLAAFSFAGPTKLDSSLLAAQSAQNDKRIVEAAQSAQNDTGVASAVIATDSKKHAVWIKLEGDVTSGMYNFCARAIGDAIKQNPDYIVFEINTFGGELNAAFDIVDTIMAVKGPTTVALVKKKAISAGSLIALSCNKLYMMESTTIGDCAPILQRANGSPEIVGEKVQSPLRAKFRNLAQKNGYPELLTSAFVTPEMEILELTTVLDSGKPGQRDSVLIIEGAKFEKFSESDKKFWGTPKVLVRAGELLTMTEVEAKNLGFSKGTVKDRQDFETALSIESRNEVETTTGESIANTIAGFSGILLILGFGALYFEFKTPGFGFFGIAGIILIGIVFLGQFAPKLDGYLPAIFLIAGIALFLVEIFVMPGTFLFGVGGIACMIIALALSYSPSETSETVKEAGEAAKGVFDVTPWLRGLFNTLTCAAIALLIPILGSKYIVPRLPEGWTPMLKTDLQTASSPTEAVQEIHIGDLGTARTFLRPVGQAQFTMSDGSTRLLDVQTRGEIIEAEQKIKVDAIQEGHIFVSVAKTIS